MDGCGYIFSISGRGSETFAVERIWHTSDSHGQILVLALRQRSLKCFKLVPLRLEQNFPNNSICAALTRGRRRGASAEAKGLVLQGSGFMILNRVSSSLFSLVDPSIRALSGRLRLTVQWHKFNKDSPSLSSRVSNVERHIQVYDFRCRVSVAGRHFQV